MWAAGYGKAGEITLLIDAGANVDLQDDRGRTALMMAAHAGYIEVVTQLLSHGSKTSLMDNDGKSAYDLAAEINNDAILQALSSAS
ncbi:MAG: hypothetical protein COB23_08050 [Methylophaga sp.]|nr:MAG: hypothetical protein COB23_08050 [Methylophaga sp.]